MNTALVGFLVILLLALAFEFINGFHDTANSIATTISTHALTPLFAILMAGTFNFIGALVSHNVAITISSGLIHGEVALSIIAAALVAAIIWNLATWYLGIPSSSSHAIIGALLGAYIESTMSFHNIIWSGVWQKVILPLITSPIAGFIIGYLIMTLLFELLRRLSQHVVNKYFSKLQILSAAFMAFSHGSNDAQKTMGIITMALVSVNMAHPGTISNTFMPASPSSIPLWVTVICALVMASGTSTGGWRVIKTMGMNMIKLQPIGGFAAETAAAVIISAASAIGAPVSTTHVISSTIMGVGAAKRLSAVRWSLAKNIVSAWILTIPVTMLLGAGISFIVRLFIR